MDVELTTMSPKGQVVIPQEVRKSLGIRPGDKFAVYGYGDIISFKTITMPSADEFRALCQRMQKFAKNKGISPEDVLKDD